MKLNNFLIILIYLYSIKSEESNEYIIMNCYYLNENNSYITSTSNKRDENALASAIYNKTYEKIGWDYLSISTHEKNDSKYNDSMKAYAMGYLEGILTKDRIFSHYTNFHKYFLAQYESVPIILKKFYDFIEDNIEYMKEKSLKNMNTDPYWEHIYYIYQQVLGLSEGYNSIADEDKKLELKQIFILGGPSDLKDIAKHLIKKLRPNFEKMTPEELERYENLNSHCTAFVKLANDSSDIWFGHNTWNYYILMIRIFKEYRFVTNKGNEKSKTVAFSSYPASLTSVDDFYVMDSNLTEMGTSINILKVDLYDLITHESIVTWIRQIVSNRLASSAEEWTKIFQRENSGTNNGQTIILDMNKIDLKNKKIDDKALMIIEQMPNYTEAADVTEHLRKGYWPSYNVPFVDKIYKDMGNIVENISEGVYENIKYTRHPRALIFKRDQGNVNSKEDFKKFMRYNDYKNDNLSENDPSKTIASRSDLGDDEYTSCHGAIDVKFISVKDLLERKNLIYIISGPSNDQQETFSWSNHTCRSDKEILSHVGHNDIWNFPWVNYNIQLFDKKSDDVKEEQQSDNTDMYWIIAACLIVIIVIIIIIVMSNPKKCVKLNKENNINRKVLVNEERDINENNVEPLLIE